MTKHSPSDLVQQFRDDLACLLNDLTWPPEHCEEAIGSLTAHAEDPITAAEIVDLAEKLLRTLSPTADPMMALRNWDRYFRASFNRAGLMRLLSANPDLLTFLSGLFAMSQFFSDIAIRNPEYVEWCLADALLETEKPLAKYREQLESFVRSFGSRESRRRALARFRRRELLRIGVRERRNHGSIREYCRELSRLAQVACEFALRECLLSAEEAHGLPVRNNSDDETGRASFIIVAMGKFGSEELNFSSDIDLVFVYDEEGKTPGRADSTGYVTGAVTSHEFYSRLARDICNYLNDPTTEGVLYRVDARLRPEGKAGAMARSLAAYSSYFVDQARSWEKIAYLKARYVAGDSKLGESFESVARSFVFSGNRHEVLLPEVARLKKRIDDNAISSDHATRDLKRGPGGIREIEFFVSALQMLHGGTRHEFRLRSTISALHLLAETGLVDRETAGHLEESYWLLRRVEHALQMLDNQQTHVIPVSLQEVHSLALRCGFDDAEDLTRELSRTRRWVRKQFEELFGEESGSRPAGLIDHLESGNPPDSETLELLAPHGLGTVEGFRALRELCVGTREIAITSRGQRVFEKLLPVLLEELKHSVDPTQAVLQLSHFLRAHHAVTPLYQLLLDHRPVLRLLLQLLGFGSMTPRMLVGHPGRFDQMLEGGALSPESTPSPNADPDYKRAVEKVDDTGTLRLLRRFKDRESLFVQAREIVGIDSIEAAAERTTQLANVCLEQLSSVIARRHGLSSNWSVIAFGGFGAGEVHLCADLDIAFFCNTDGEEAPPVELQKFASDLLAELSAVTPEGRLWKTDARLRPDGSSGPLVVTLKRAHRYYESEAGVWEFQSATRARHAAGNENISRRALEIVRESWRERLPGLSLRDEIVSMRNRMENSLRLPRSAEFDLKHSPGGLIDIEFLIQFLKLSHPEKHERLWTPRPAEALTQIREAGLLSDHDADRLVTHYHRLRTVQRMLRLLFETSKDLIPRQDVKRRQLARALAPHLDDATASLTSLPREMEEIRVLFNRTLTESNGEL